MPTRPTSLVYPKTPEKREMLQWWADFVVSQIQDGRGNVIIGPIGKAYQSAA